MSFKMSELVRLSNVPKSTILYYFKEGLLPPAQKPKPNVHIYNNEHIQLIKYIKYMQTNMKCSISQLKMIMQNKNQSFSSSSSMIEPFMQALEGIEENQRYYTKKEVLKKFSIKESFLNDLLLTEIVMPIKEDQYGNKEVAMIRLVQNFESVGVDYKILKKYVEHAKELAVLERELKNQTCDRKDKEEFSTLWGIIFETIFTAKPYILNRLTHKEYLKILEEEVNQQNS